MATSPSPASSASPNSIRCRLPTSPAATTSIETPSISFGSCMRAIRSRISSARWATVTLGRNSPTSMTTGALVAVDRPAGPVAASAPAQPGRWSRARSSLTRSSLTRSSLTWSAVTPRPAAERGLMHASRSGRRHWANCSSEVPRSARGKSKAWLACGSSPPGNGSSGSARSPVSSASRRTSSGPKRDARLLRGSRITPPIESIPTSRSFWSVPPSNRSPVAGNASTRPPGATTTLRRRPRGAGSPASAATRSTWWAAAQAAPGVSAIAPRAWRPRAASVHTAVRASLSSPPKKPAVAVTSR